MSTYRVAIATMGCALALSCGSSTSPGSGSAPADVTAALHDLSTKAIYFGHQSVGYDIMGGVEALIAATSGAVPTVVGTSDPASIEKGIFAHSANGSNGDPVSKTAAFQETIQGGVGSKVDIAFFKFCFVDFGGSTDVAAVFADYRDKMAALKSAYPSVRFVHFTVPLTTGSSGDNAVREQFSDLVRQTYGGKEPVFDVAKVEATRPDGSAEAFDGVRALVPAHSSDGGHLNDTGAAVVSKALVAYLASL
jgi:hypothetical protein